jgi:hypothetical protein
MKEQTVIQEIAALAMTAQSDPYAQAHVYRKALIDICNLALSVSAPAVSGEAQGSRSAAFCGGARIGLESAGCGGALRYEHTANGIEYWRCPACGNPHWWPAPPSGESRVPSEAGTETGAKEQSVPTVWDQVDALKAALEQSEQARARAEAAHGLIVAKLGLSVETPGVEIASRISQLREAESQRAALQAQLDLSERRLATSEECRNNLASGIATLQAERDEAVKERDRLKAAVDLLSSPTGQELVEWAKTHVDDRIEFTGQNSRKDVVMRSDNHSTLGVVSWPDCCCGHPIDHHHPSEPKRCARSGCSCTHYWPNDVMPSSAVFVPESERVNCVDSWNDQHGYECVLCGHRLGQQQALPARVQSSEGSHENGSAREASLRAELSTLHAAHARMREALTGILAAVEDTDWQLSPLAVRLRAALNQADAALASPSQPGSPVDPQTKGD